MLKSKPIEMLRNSRRSLMLFDHGLGDMVLALPIFKELQLQINRRFDLGASAKRQFSLLDSSIIDIHDSDFDLSAKYDFIYRVRYPDSVDPSTPIEYHDEPPKPYICAYFELGMKEFVWKPYQIPNKNDLSKSKRVGLHLFGHTGMGLKFCPMDIAEQIWNEVKDAGYEPFECHMRPNFSKDYKDYQCGDTFFPANKNNSLRFEIPSLKRLIDEIAKCRYFIGIDSGPAYLSTALIGADKLIGLTNKKLHSQFLPYHITTVPVMSYKPGTIAKKLKQKEMYCYAKN